MGKRILLSGILGGIAMFMWLSIAHVVLPLGETGIRDIPNEEAMLAAMRANIPESGFYFFPGTRVLVAGTTRAERDAAMASYNEKLAAGPSGIMIYHARGNRGITPGRLFTELGNNILLALLVSVLLSFATGLRSYGARVGFVTIAGIMAGLTTNISYWNWYGFPSSYTTAYTFTEIVGYLCIGLVAARIIRHDAMGGMRAGA